MIEIKNPCDANWQEMSLAETGKYCGDCEKVVVDFSKMNDIQIKEYFTEFATQKTCGRFLTSQVDRPLKVSTPAVSSRFWKQVNRFPVFKSLMLICASSVLWLSSCVKKHVVTGEAENSTCEPILMGDTIANPIKPDTTTKIEEDTLHFLQGEVAEPVHIKMGKVRMTDTISQKIKHKNK